MNISNILQEKRENFRLDIRKQKLEQIYKNRRLEVLQKQTNLSENEVKLKYLNTQEEIHSMAIFDTYSRLGDLRQDLLMNKESSLQEFKEIIIGLISIDHIKLIEIFDMKQNNISFIDYLLGKLQSTERDLIVELFAYITHKLFEENNSIANNLLQRIPLLLKIIDEEEDSRCSSLVLLFSYKEIVSILGDLIRQSDYKIIIESYLLPTCIKIIDKKMHNVSVMFLETFSYLILQISFTDLTQSEEKIIQIFPTIIALYHFLKNIECSFYLYLAITSFTQQLPKCLKLLFKSNHLIDIIQPFLENENEDNSVLYTIEMIKVFQQMIQLDYSLGKVHIENPVFLNQIVKYSSGNTQKYLKLQEESISLLTLSIQNKMVLNDKQIFAVLEGFADCEDQLCQVAYIDFITNLISEQDAIIVFDNLTFSEILREAFLRSVKQPALCQLLYSLLFYQNSISEQFIRNLKLVRIMDILDEIAMRNSDETMHNQINCISQYLQ